MKSQKTRKAKKTKVTKKITVKKKVLQKKSKLSKKNNLLPAILGIIVTIAVLILLCWYTTFIACNQSTNKNMQSNNTTIVDNSSIEGSNELDAYSNSSIPILSNQPKWIVQGRETGFMYITDGNDYWLIEPNKIDYWKSDIINNIREFGIPVEGYNGVYLLNTSYYKMTSPLSCIPFEFNE